MAFDCGACFAKYVLCLYNFVFFLVGLAVAAVAAWLLADKQSFVAILNVVDNEHIQQYTQAAVIEQATYWLICIGIVMLIVSGLGYCGAVRESPCLLTGYGIVLIILLLSQIVVVGLSIAYRAKAEEETQKYLKTSIEKYYTTSDRSDAVTLMWNNLMAQMSCCGVDSYEDFKLSPKWNGVANKTIPEACCVLNDTVLFKPKDPNCPYSPTEANSYYKIGCYKTLINWIMRHSNIVICALIGLTVVQVVAIFLAFCLCKSLDRFLK